MQDNTDQPPSLSQLLRESYLAEARAQQRHSEVSRSDASSSRLHIYGPLKGRAEEPQLPDLSAFLSQEELDKSVNLARQAIGHGPREDRPEVKASSSASSSSAATPPPPPPPCSGSSAPVPSSSPAPSAQPAPEASDRKMLRASTRQDNALRDSAEGFNDLSRSGRTAPYGPETQSKKEFLNKAADFIEELSSLFKANSSKRVRPRSCKPHRSRNQSKGHSEGAGDPLGADHRERAAAAAAAAAGAGAEGPGPAVSRPPEVRPGPGVGPPELQDRGITEEQRCEPGPREAEREAGGRGAEEPVCEPPHFIQKLKSREVAEGSKVQLDCVVRGLPVPEVR